MGASSRPVRSRQPAVAGTFYPGVPRELDEAVADFVAKAPVRAERPAPKAMVVPHAGYVYSGPVAGTAYAALRDVRSRIERVVLLGPSHRVPVRGLATTSADVFLTPLGSVPIDREAVSEALRFPQVRVIDDAHAQEHSLEVQLPFLQHCLDDFSLVPFSVGDASAEEVAVVLEALWGGPETLIVVSSDLSHYHDYESARRLDANTTRAIEELAPERLDSESACGRVPVRGLLLTAKRYDLEVETVDLRNSGDTAGPRDRVVGYGSYLFRPRTRPKQAEGGTGSAKRSPRRPPPTLFASAMPAKAASKPAAPDRWEDGFGDVLLAIARRSIEYGLDSGEPLSVDLEVYPPALCAIRASFVTLKLEGQLRGCIGSLEARRPLVEDVAQSAHKAAFADPRFAPVTAEELPRLDLHVSVLSPMAPLSFASEEDLLSQLRPGVDGLLLRDSRAQGTFLPDVWESLPEPREFLRRLKQKAGLSPDHWSPSLQAFRYTTRSIG